MLALCSAGASPGVSTLAVLLAAASSHAAVVVEADPDGGCLGARFDLVDDPGLVTLAAAARRGADGDLLRAHGQPMSATVDVVLAPPSAQAARSVLASSADLLADVCRSATDADVIVDCGRLSPTSPAWPLATAAELIVLVTRPRLDETRRLPSRVGELRESGVEVGVVVVGDRPYSPVEVADAAGAELLGVLVDDPRTAAVVNGTGGTDRALRRSPLWKSTIGLAHSLDARAADRSVVSEEVRPELATVEGQR